MHMNMMMALRRISVPIMPMQNRASERKTIILSRQQWLISVSNVKVWY